MDRCLSWVCLSASIISAKEVGRLWKRGGEVGCVGSTDENEDDEGVLLI